MKHAEQSNLKQDFPTNLRQAPKKAKQGHVILKIIDLQNIMKTIL